MSISRNEYARLLCSLVVFMLSACDYHKIDNEYKSPEGADIAFISGHVELTKGILGGDLAKASITPFNIDGSNSVAHAINSANLDVINTPIPLQAGAHSIGAIFLINKLQADINTDFVALPREHYKFNFRVDWKNGILFESADNVIYWIEDAAGKPVTKEQSIVPHMVNQGSSYVTVIMPVKK